MVGVVEEAKCPEKRKKSGRLTHIKTIPQAAGNNNFFQGG